MLYECQPLQLIFVKHSGDFKVYYVIQIPYLYSSYLLGEILISKTNFDVLAPRKSESLTGFSAITQKLHQLKVQKAHGRSDLASKVPLKCMDSISFLGEISI